MNWNPREWSQLTKAYAVIAFLTALFIAFMVLPRLSQLSRYDKELKNLRGQRSKVKSFLPEYARLQWDAEEISPDMPQWLTSKILAGMEKNLESNNPLDNGKASDVELKRLDPSQVFQVFTQLQTGKLILTYLELADWDSDGKWNMRFIVEVADD